ncbi:hypothetical protein G6F53_013805 [Rhizopus delemar]|nr:hypothetical protein G6F53_013805 [Rhizopus delemar]
MGQALEIALQQLFARVTQDPAQRVVDVQPAPFQRNQGHAQRGGRERTGELFRRQAGLGTGLQDLGDVDGHADIADAHPVGPIHAADRQAHLPWLAILAQQGPLPRVAAAARRSARPDHGRHRAGAGRPPPERCSPAGAALRD